jgi:hypothetical protein
MSRKPPDRVIPATVLVILHIPVLLLVTPLALLLVDATHIGLFLLLIPAALVAAYAWCMPRVRRWRGSPSRVQRHDQRTF